MGNITSSRLSLHRFLALTVSHSTTVDPRHLEHHVYPYWTADFAALIVSGNLEYSLLAPQFPVYVSPKEPSPGPDDSGRTEADGEAEGVYVDIAVVMPVVQPRYADELGALGLKLVGKSLLQFFDDFKPHLSGISPRCLWVSGHEAALLGELKPGPTRHAKEIKTFLSSLIGLGSSARTQVEAQSLCLLCSWRFGTQDEVLLLAGTGDYYQIRRVTRGWASEKLGGERYRWDTLRKLKTAAKQLDPVGEDGDWTEGQEEEMYGNPGSAKDRQKRLNDKRHERAEKPATRAERFAKALNVLPSTDRTTSPFSHEALNELHRIQHRQDLFESEDPEKYFSGDGPSNWSGVLHLGSEISNQYMTRIEEFIRRFEERETERRKAVLFRMKPSGSTASTDYKPPATTAKAKGKQRAKPGSKPSGGTR
ncbi:hypothetical protein GGX14DRAFT_583935 [Mycena pura]|uniref:Uncharacterized protein n=1 Tax=Mycena pura TaxID=153505 RepID=A0AAD6YVK0_9AGAR|nr:hypothetical protein GGX14DRAFT_583935 [Mycena pura]